MINPKLEVINMSLFEWIGGACLIGVGFALRHYASKIPLLKEFFD